MQQTSATNQRKQTNANICKHNQIGNERRSDRTNAGGWAKPILPGGRIWERLTFGRSTSGAVLHFQLWALSGQGNDRAGEGGMRGVWLHPELRTPYSKVLNSRTAVRLISHHGTQLFKKLNKSKAPRPPVRRPLAAWELFSHVFLILFCPLSC